MSRTIHGGWFRCRLRPQSKPANHRWIYYHVVHVGSHVEFRREARFRGGQYLHRQIFDFESVVVPPTDLTLAKQIDGMKFFFQGALAAVPPPISTEASA